MHLENTPPARVADGAAVRGTEADFEIPLALPADPVYLRRVVRGSKVRLVENPRWQIGGCSNWELDELSRTCGEC